MEIGNKYLTERNKATKSEAISTGAAGAFIIGNGPTAVAFADSRHELIAAAMERAISVNYKADATPWVLPIDTHRINVSETTLSSHTMPSPPISAGGVPFP